MQTVKDVLDTFSSMFFPISSIIYINNGTVKYLSARRYDTVKIYLGGIPNIIVIKRENDAVMYYWTEFDVGKDNSVIIKYVYEFVITDNDLLRLLEELPETSPNKAFKVIRRLYNYLKKGYKMTFVKEEIEE
jgi:hypothetical protein